MRVGLLEGLPSPPELARDGAAAEASRHHIRALGRAKPAVIQLRLGAAPANAATTAAAAVDLGGLSRRLFAVARSSALSA